MASDQNHLVVVKQLIQAGADLNLYDEVYKYSDINVITCRY